MSAGSCAVVKRLFPEALLPFPDFENCCSETNQSAWTGGLPLTPLGGCCSQVKAVTPSLAALALLCERVITSIPALLRYGREPTQPDDAPVSIPPLCHARSDRPYWLPHTALCRLDDGCLTALWKQGKSNGKDAGA